MVDHRVPDSTLLDMLRRSMDVASRVNLSNGNTLQLVVGPGMVWPEGAAELVARTAERGGFSVDLSQMGVGVFALTRVGGQVGGATGAGRALDATVQVSGVSAETDVADILREMLGIQRETLHSKDDWSRDQKIAVMAIIIAILLAVLDRLPR